MTNHQLAKLLGAFSVESRLAILGGLVAAGEEGLTELDLASITGLSANAVWRHLDFMTNTEIVKVKMNGMSKAYTANFSLIIDLFAALNQNYGTGLTHARYKDEPVSQEKT